MPAMSRIIISLPADLLERIDAARGDVPRAAWLRKAAEVRLSEGAPEVQEYRASLEQRAVALRRDLTAASRQVEPRFK